MADDSKKVVVQLKEIIRELQNLQDGNKHLLEEYSKAGEELVDATKEGDQETIKYLKEFREQAKKELGETVKEKLGNKEIDPHVLRTALAAAPHAPQIKEINDEPLVKRAPSREEQEAKKNEAKLAKMQIQQNLRPEKEHSEHVKDAGADPKASNAQPLTTKSFKDGLSKVLSSFNGGAAAVRDRYRKGAAVSENIVRGITALPKKLGGVLEGLPLISGIANFIKGFANTVGAALATVGALVSLSGFLKGWENAKKWFGENANFWEKLSSGLATIAQTFFGLSDEDAQALAQKLAAGFKAVGEFIKDVFNATVNVVKVAWANIDKFIGGFKTLWEGITSGNLEQILDGTKSIGQVLLDVGKAIWDNKLALVPIFALFGGPILAAITSIAGVVGGIATALVGTILPIFVGLLKVIGGGLAAALGPIGVVVAGIAAALIVFKAGWDGIKTGIEEYKKSGNIFKAIWVGIKGAVSSFTGIFTTAWDYVKGFVSGVVDATKKAIDGVKSAFMFVIEGLRSIGNFIYDSIATAVKWVKDAAMAIYGALIAVKDFIVQSVVTVVQSIKAAFEFVWNGLVSVKNFIVNGVMSAVKLVSDAVNAVAMAFQNVWTFITTAVQTGINFISTVLTGIWNALTAVGQVFVNISTTIGGLLLDGVNAISNTISGIASFVGGVLLGAFTTISNFFNDNISPVLESLVGAASSFANGIVGVGAFLTEAAKAVVNFASGGGIMQTIQNGLNSLGSAITDTLSGIWNLIIEGLASVIELIPFGGKDIAAKIRGAKMQDSGVHAAPSSNVTGAQQASEENRRLREQKQNTAAPQPIIVQQSNVSNNSSTTMANPMSTRSGGSFNYVGA